MTVIAWSLWSEVIPTLLHSISVLSDTDCYRLSTEGFYSMQSHFLNNPCIDAQFGFSKCCAVDSAVYNYPLSYCNFPECLKC